MPFLAIIDPTLVVKEGAAAYEIDQVSRGWIRTMVWKNEQRSLVTIRRRLLAVALSPIGDSHGGILGRGIFPPLEPIRVAVPEVAGWMEALWDVFE